jgi:hypothetical protein
MPTFAFSRGQNVLYNGACYAVQRFKGEAFYETTLSEPKYLIKKLSDNSVVDNVAEAELSNATCEQVINEAWTSFTYTGDNGSAGQWVMNNIIKKMYQCNMQSQWGHNDDSSVYTYKMGMMTWTKDRT